VNGQGCLTQRRKAGRVFAGALLLSTAAGCGGVEKQVETKPTYRLVRFGYETDGCLHYLDADFEFEHPSGALVRIEQALEKAEHATKKAKAPQENTDKALVRTVEIAVENGPFGYFVVEDPGGNTGEVVLFLSAERRQARAVLYESTFLHWLRVLAQRAVLASMHSPRQPLEWHYVALAHFLSIQIRPYADASTFIEYLREASDPRAVARALYPNAGGFQEHQFAPFLGSDEIALRLLPLVRSSLLGSREAVQEILTLSLEYHGELPVFESAVRALFPAALNGDLYREYPLLGGSAAAAAFLLQVQTNLDKAKYRGEAGYVLDRTMGQSTKT